MTGWQAERFARTKRLKPVADYLNEEPKKSAETGARDVRAMFDRMIAKQEARGGD